MPNGCQEVRRNGECCPIMECDSGSFVTSTTNLKSIGNGGLIHVLRPSGSMQYVLPTGLTGTTPVPGTGGTGFVAPRICKSIKKIVSFLNLEILKLCLYSSNLEDR